MLKKEGRKQHVQREAVLQFFLAS